MFDKMDLIVGDVPSAAAFFREVLGFALRAEFDRFAELESGAVTIMLSPDALVPTRPAAGVILHLRVDDVARALERARERGASVLLEPTGTDWGTQTAMIAGSEEIVIELYRPLEGPEENDAWAPIQELHPEGIRPATPRSTHCGGPARSCRPCPVIGHKRPIFPLGPYSRPNLDDSPRHG